MSSSITFYSGADTVTGANFLLDTGSSKILVDCGTLQRETNHCDESNSKAFAYNPGDIDVLIVTHAHADHIGRIPKLVHDGFKGTIYSTPATHDLASIMFDDALNVMRTESEKHGCDVLYEKPDVERAMSLWQSHEYHDTFQVGDTSVEFLDAGHILGSAMARFTRSHRTIIFTGDLGNSPEPLLNDTESPVGANYIVMESVYGDRLHEGRDERVDALQSAIESTRERQGTLLIPSFSLERTQVLLFEIDKLIEKGMQSIPVYLDSPLAIRATEVFRTYPELLNPDAQAHFRNGRDPFTFKNLQVVHSTGESRDIHKVSGAKVIIAGAGMSSGGRIRAHEVQYLPDKNASVLFVGYQAPGSLGRRIQDGARSVVIDGVTVPIHASIDSLGGYSGHADRDGLLNFVEKATTTEDGSPSKLEKVFVVMGEPRAELFIAQRIHDFLGVEAHVPGAGESVQIDF